MSQPDNSVDPGQQALLQRIPAITHLLQAPEVQAWQRQHPLPLVTDSLRKAVAQARQAVLAGERRDPPGQNELLRVAGDFLARASAPRIRQAINATGIILHTGLGRAVLSSGVVDSILPELKGCCTLAIDVETGERAERDELVQPILTELNGAEAATVVNNNAAATMLVLAALAAGKEIIVSRGQLIEIGGSFRLPEVMAQSRAKLVEVGATNRTHLKDYRRAITPETAALMRVHPSNYRIVGFTSEVGLRDLVELAHGAGLIVIDDLGAGALVGLEQFGLPHEPTVRESIEAGADMVLFSGDKLIGGSQAGIIVGRKSLVDRLRSHPLMRAVRPDKTCLLLLERTLQLFRDPSRLAQALPTYGMLGTTVETLERRAAALEKQLEPLATKLAVSTAPANAYLGSGSLPTEAIPSVSVRVRVHGMSAADLLKKLRMDPATVFGRIEEDIVHLDMRTVTDAQVTEIAAAIRRIVLSGAA
jgi:L-seryl-tRNA(Ser) seleniumtransferase